MIGSISAGAKSEQDGDEKSNNNQKTGCPPGEAGRAKEIERTNGRPIAGVAGVVNSLYPPEVCCVIIQFQIVFFGG